MSSKVFTSPTRRRSFFILALLESLPVLLVGIAAFMTVFLQDVLSTLTGLVIGVCLLLLAGISFLTAYLFVGRSASFIEPFESGTDKLAGGELNVRFPENMPDEVGRIAKNLNRIVGLIKGTRKDLEEKVRTELESELLAEKHRMEAFLKGIGDGISIVDRDMRIIWINDATKNVFGDHIGEYCYKVYEHKNDVCGGCPVQSAYRTGEVHQSLRRVYSKKGRLLYYENTGSPIKDENGEIIAGIEMARDVTQRIKLERSVEIRSRELAKANEELKNANEELKKAYEELKNTQGQLLQTEKMASLGVLVAGVAHEINNPINFVYGSMKLMEDNLNGILSLIQEFEKAPMAEEQRTRIESLKEEIDYEYVIEDVQKIVKNVTTGAERIREIVNNLRTFSRVDSSEKSMINVHEGIESTLTLLYHEYKNRIEIKKDFGELPQLAGNAGKLNQVFMNIIHNAIQAIPEKGEIRIQTYKEDPYAVIKITDSGKGIPQNVVDKIFDPFFTTKKVGEGTGLGLSISFSIIRDHGGTIEADSKENEGTSFTIKLPLGLKPTEKTNGNPKDTDLPQSEVSAQV